jgi:hypothetical protein
MPPTFFGPLVVPAAVPLRRTDRQKKNAGAGDSAYANPKTWPQTKIKPPPGVLASQVDGLVMFLVCLALRGV